ncbi:MAG: redoxin family protein [Prevotella sp.]|jgi:thiol-disulfide isomerase/thioredoxin
MKKLFLTFLVLLSAVGASAQKAVITGTADSIADGSKVFLAEMQGFFSFIPHDSTIVKDGKFALTVEQKDPQYLYLIILNKAKPKDMRMRGFILEPGEFSFVMNRGENGTSLKGGRDNELWDAYEKSEDDAYATVDGVWRLSKDSTQSAEVRKKAAERLKAFDDSLKAARYDRILANIPSGFSSVLLSMNYFDMPEEVLTKILDAMANRCPDDAVYKSIVAEREATARTSVGKTYTDITQPGVDGKPVSVSTYVKKNKLTLIDFWASWCGPCRAEMPNVVAAYNKYHNKGFEVVGVSLDNRREAWVKAISQLKMPWPQMSDLKGWQSAGAAAYNVKAIPSNVLIDANGRIIAKDLRGEDLTGKLAELLDK